MYVIFWLVYLKRLFFTPYNTTSQVRPRDARVRFIGRTRSISFGKTVKHSLFSIASRQTDKRMPALA